MRILMMSVVYAPEGSGARTHDLAVGLAALGHAVTAITGLPSNPQGRVYEGFQVRPYQWEDRDGVRILRVPYVLNRSRSALSRFLSYGDFALLASALGLPRAGRPDVVWTHQVGLPGLLASPLRGCPLVHEVQDFWLPAGRSAIPGLQGPLYRALDAQERLVYRAATRIATISDGFRRRLVDAGVPESKIDVVPVWTPGQAAEPAAPDFELGESEGLAGRFNVLYAGNLRTEHAARMLLDTAQKLADLPMPDVQLVVIGDSAERSWLETDAAERGLGNVRFLGPRPAAQMSAYMAWADVLLLQTPAGPLADISIPPKMYSYLASGRPILASAGGEVAALIRETEAGIVAPPGSGDALAEGVRVLHDLSAEERHQLGENGRRAFAERFQRDRVVHRYEKVFKTAIAQYEGAGNSRREQLYEGEE